MRSFKHERFTYIRELRAEQAAIKSIKWITPIARSAMTHVGAQQDKGYRDILKSTGRTSLPVLLGEGILFGLAELLVPFSQKLPEINPDPGLRL